MSKKRQGQKRQGGQKRKAADSTEEKVYNKVKNRELKRFYKAVDSAIKDLLSQKYGQADDYEEYQKYAGICAFVKDNLRSIDLIAERLSPLFMQTGERSNWEIYLSGIGQLNRKLPDSYLSRTVFSMYKLDDFKGKLLAFSGEWLEYLREAHKTLSQVDDYLKNLAKGQEVMESYQAGNEELARLYASLKTWETEEEFNELFDNFASFLESSIEVFISGPIQLYLMIGRDTFLLIFKALTIGKLSDLVGDDKKYAELMALHDFVFDLIKDSKTIEVFQELLKRAAKQYAQLLQKEHLKIRNQLPGKDRKRRFVDHFESGALFKTGE